MGEESFGSLEEMAEEQLEGKLSFLRTEVERLSAEKAKRVTASQGTSAGAPGAAAAGVASSTSLDDIAAQAGRQQSMAGSASRQNLSRAP